MTLTSERVSAVITAFNPTLELVSNCRSLLPQVRQIVVVDDGSTSGEEVFSRLREEGVTVINSPTNQGIAAAINKGYKALGVQWDNATTDQFPIELIITFDQDSTVPDGFVETMVKTYDSYKDTLDSIGLIAPEKFSGVKQTRADKNIPFLSAHHPIQSGIMMPTEVISALGPQREDYFIDSVDTEYYYRCLTHGYKALAVKELDLGHSLGHIVSLKLFGIKAVGPFTKITVSSPFRYYYRIRNRILLTKQYGKYKQIKKFICINNYKEFRHYCIALLATSNRKNLLAILLAGLKAGRNNIGGKMPENLSELAKTISWSHPAN